MKRKFFLVISLIAIYQFIAAQIPADGLVGYWSFSGNANDESGNNLNGSTQGGVSLSEDRFGNANSSYYFDGTDDYIQVADNDLLSFANNQFTFNIWLKMDGQFDQNRVFLCKTNITSNFEYTFGYFSNIDSIFFHTNVLGGNCGIYGDYDPVPTISEWVHYVYTANGTTSYLYKNGQLISTKEKSDCNLGNGSGALYIGRGGGWNQIYYFRGWIDDLRIYNRFVSSDEVKELYGIGYCSDTIVNDTIEYHVSSLEFENSSPIVVLDSTQTLTQSNGICDSVINHYSAFKFDPLHYSDTIYEYVYDTISENNLNGLIAYYPFNGNAEDESGYNNHGMVEGASLTTDRYGNGNSAYFFDGQNDYINLGNLGGYSSHTFTGWFKIEGQQSGYGALVSKLYNDLHFAKNSEIRIDQDRGEGFNISSQLGTGSTWEGTHIDIPVDTSTWHQFAYMYDDNEKSIKVYLDNILVDSIVVSGYSDVSTTPTYIGARPYWNGPTVFFFNGKINDVRIYNKSLSTNEINSLFNQGKCFETIYDTIHVYDSISVTDTLIIDAVLTGIIPPENINTLKVYPNPTKDYIFINTGDYTKINGYQLKIINNLGVTVFETMVEEPLYEVNLSTWSGYGMYYLQLIDSGGSIIDIRKIILQ